MSSLTHAANIGEWFTYNAFPHVGIVQVKKSTSTNATRLNTYNATEHI